MVRKPQIRLADTLHEELLYLYNQRLYDSEIAKRLHCSVTVVANWRRSNNLKPNKFRGHRERLEKMELLKGYLDEGMERKAIADFLEISESTVYIWKRELE